MKHLLLSTCLVLAACGSSELNSTVAGFGETSSRAMNALESSLDAYGLQQETDTRAELAASATRLYVSAQCDAAIADPGIARTGCMVVDNTETEIELSTDVSTIRSLIRSVRGYSASIGILAGSPDEDLEAYRNAIDGLVTSFGTLQQGVATVTRAPEPTTTTVGALGSIVANAGALYLEQKRANALADIIIAANPAIQQAVGVMLEAEDALSTVERTRAIRAADAASNALEDAILKGAPTKTIRARQDAVFAARDTIVAVASRPMASAAVGAAHQELVALARGGASLSDINIALGKLVVSAQAIEAALDDL